MILMPAAVMVFCSYKVYARLKEVGFKSYLGIKLINLLISILYLFLRFVFKRLLLLLVQVFEKKIEQKKESSKTLTVHASAGVPLL